MGSLPDTATDALLEALAQGVQVFDLGREMFIGMPQSPNHPQFRTALQRRHGDVMRDDGGSAASELLVTGTHVGTHVDALAHVSHCMRLYGGVDAAEAQTGGRFSAHGIENVAPMVCRGVLIDVGECAPGHEVTPDELEAACPAGLRPGDVALVRTGWGRHWPDVDAYVGRESGVPGPGEAGARWLASKRVRAAGSDTIAFERVEAGKGHALLPAHRVLLVEEGIHIIETLDLEGLSAAGVTEFLFVMAPLKLVGATGSPVRPLAVVTA